MEGDRESDEDSYFDAAEFIVPLQAPLTGAAAMEAVLSNMDMLKLLFSELGLPDLCRVSSVCKIWNNVSCSDEFWRDVSFEGRFLYSSQVPTCRSSSAVALVPSIVAVGRSPYGIFLAMLAVTVSFETIPVLVPWSAASQVTDRKVAAR